MKRLTIACLCILLCLGMALCLNMRTDAQLERLYHSVRIGQTYLDVVEDLKKQNAQASVSMWSKSKTDDERLMFVTVRGWVYEFYLFFNLKNDIVSAYGIRSSDDILHRQVSGLSDVYGNPGDCFLFREFTGISLKKGAAE